MEVIKVRYQDRMEDKFILDTARATARALAILLLLFAPSLKDGVEVRIRPCLVHHLKCWWLLIMVSWTSGGFRRHHFWVLAEESRNY
jgi:hypothetical protein